ncbi:MAG: murein transglycosylase [Chitinophagales bacterium]|nr:MAG: murein transglycosylase [Chitinophagales bacterium]
MHRSSYPVLLFLGLLITLSVIFRSSQQSPQSGESPTALPGTPQQIVPVEIPAQLDFAGEPVPLDITDVRERLDRELLVNTYWHSNTLQLFKLASRWLSLIEKILQENGIPDDFKYMALAESGFRNVVSPADAVGFWQFLEGAAKDYGLEISVTVDERYDPLLSTLAACRYLNDAYQEFGSWTLAAAAFNMGKKRLKSVLEEQKVTSYYELYLNEETARYVFRVLALKEIFSNPQKYGFFIKPEDLYPPLKYRVVFVDYDIADLAAFAQENKTNYKTLRLLNPWLRKNYLKTQRGKVYQVRLPATDEDKTFSALSRKHG